MKICDKIEIIELNMICYTFKNSLEKIYFKKSSHLSMSFEGMDEEPLLNEEPNISTIAEESKCKKPSCLVLALIGVGATALLILIIGLSIGLSGKNPNERTVKPEPIDASRTIPLTNTPVATPTIRPTQQMSSSYSSSITSTTTGFSPAPTKTPT